MDLFRNPQTIQSNQQVIQQTPRPTQDLSAFDCCAQWLEVCPFPADPEVALKEINDLLKTEEQQSLIGQSNTSIFHESIKSRKQNLEFLIQKKIFENQQRQLFPSAPNLLNVARPAYRYFRALVWNLENFTHDKRPAGTQAIHSMRNQARIAITADFAFRIGADALLIMETGSDVGQAMTLLANCWGEKEKTSSDFFKRSVEPLVSAPTHGLQELPLVVQAQRYDAAPDILRSLMLAGEGYSIRPAFFPNITEDVLRNALNLLVQTSNNFQKFGERPPMTGNLGDSLVLWCYWCLKMLEFHGFELAEREDIELIRSTLAEAAQSPQQFLSQPDMEIGKVLWTILAARDVAAYYGSPTLEAGVAEIIQLLLMAWIIVKGCGTLDPKPTMKSKYPRPLPFSNDPPLDLLLPPQLTIWLNDYGEPADLVVLALFLGAGQHLTLSAHDQENGAIFSASDGELLINALIRLGILAKPHAETYGVVYRPYTSDHLSCFLEAPFEQLGLSTEGIYGIVHGDNKSLLVSQQSGNILAGRSALKISFPVTKYQWVPFALHHNRFSGSKEISVMEKKYVKDENTVLARLMTLEDEARLLAGQYSPALIVGDFNLPSGYVQQEEGRKSKTVAGGRRAEIREKHFREMKAAGYLRRQRINLTSPETTLKRAMNIAKGEATFSQPYDAVYQPFDFLGGQVIVRSAAVRNCNAFFTPTLLEQKISVATEKDQLVEMTIKQVLIDKIQGTYMGIVWAIIGTLNDAEPWLSKNKGSMKTKTAKAAAFLIENREEFGNWLMQRKNVFQKLLWSNFFGACTVQAQFDWFQKMKGEIDSVTDFIKDAVKKEKKAKAEAKKKEKSTNKKVKTSSKSNSNLTTDIDMEEDDWDIEDDDDGEEESSASTPTKRVRPKKPGEQRLIELDKLFTALMNLEKYSEKRLWGAYGGIVSDHLPLLVEVEFLI